MIYTLTRNRISKDFPIQENIIRFMGGHLMYSYDLRFIRYQCVKQFFEREGTRFFNSTSINLIFCKEVSKNFIDYGELHEFDTFDVVKIQTTYF